MWQDPTRQENLKSRKNKEVYMWNYVTFLLSLNPSENSGQSQAQLDYLRRKYITSRYVCVQE
jgi:hypothetical protein